MIRVFVIAVWLIPTAVSKYFPPSPQNLTVISSKFEDGVSISYREVRVNASSRRSVIFGSLLLTGTL